MAGVRDTLVGAELVATAAPNDLATLAGAEYAATIPNTLRDTLAGAEYAATIPNTLRDTLVGVEYIAQTAPTCTAEFIQAATTGDVDAVTAYVDDKVAALPWKTSVRAATTAAGTLASSFEAGDVIDGVTVAAGDRILVKNQAAGTENGIYVVAISGAPTRATDADTAAKIRQATVYVEEGATLADTQWSCTTNAPITLGSTSLSFTQLSGGGGGSAPAWVTDSPMTPPVSADAADDEFGGTFDAGETALDTTGGRNGGSRTAWARRNAGTGTDSIDPKGGLIYLPQVNGQVRGVEQAVPAGNWRIRARISCRADAAISNSVILGLYGVNNGNGKLIIAGPATIGAGLVGLYSSVWNSVSSFSADRKVPANSDPCHSYSGWLEAEYNGTALIFRYSATGDEGSFSKFVSETVATFLGGLTHIGLFGYADGGSPQPIALFCKPWRKVA